MTRLLTVWADIARIDAEHDQRLQRALERPQPRKRRRPIQGPTWFVPAPIGVTDEPRRDLLKRLTTAASLSPNQRWKLAAKWAADKEAEQAA